MTCPAPSEGRDDRIAATNDEWVDAVAVPPLPEWDPEEGVDVWFDLVPIEEAGDA